MEKNQLINDLKKRMDGAISSLDHDLKGLRTGRASVNLLDPVVIEAYGDKMHISQLATITAPEPRLLTVQVWDRSMVKAVEKAIAEANLGVNPTAEGQTIRVPLPVLTEERRKELSKLAHKYGENAKVSARNVRRDIMELLKKAEKDSTITKDEHHSTGEEVQKITDDYTKKIDTMVTSKEKEIMTM
jgi:ribosome recycling factor